MRNKNLPSLFSDFAYNFNPSSLPTSSINIFKICLADWVSISIAAQGSKIAKIILTLAKEEGSVQDSFIFGHKSYVSCKTAALINGTISHALDYDDTHFLFVGHPTSSALPTALALGEELELSIEDLLLAYMAGVEVSTRIGHILGYSHYNAGFHQSATSGSFGATIVASKLLNLSEDQTINALGLVSTRASGIKSQFGTMGKPYHAGMAASNGIEAA